MMNYTQGSTITEKANHTYNAKDKNRVKHVKIVKMND
jgi:hypothetical protein